SRRRHTRFSRDWSSDVCSSDLERPFKCLKCRSTFVRRDLLLRHDRTVHAKDGGIPLHSEVKRRSKNSSTAGPSKPTIAIEPAIRSEERRVGKEYRGRLSTDQEK